MNRVGLGVALGFVAATGAMAQAKDDAASVAALFGARADIEDLSLSPDGTQVAYLKPTEGQGSALYVAGSETGAKPHFVFGVSGKPERLGGCHWASKDRIVCTVYGVVSGTTGLLLPFTRLIAIDADGKNGQILSTKQTFASDGAQLSGGRVIDWLPDEDGAVLMTRNYVPDITLGVRGGSDKRGYEVDRVDTRTLAIKPVEIADPEAVDYISDGRGSVRIRGRRTVNAGGMDAGRITYAYRLAGDRAWQPLGDYDYRSHEGFDPFAIDHDRNLAYGLLKKDGRQAFYAVSLDGSNHEELIFDRPDVDVDGLIRLGRRNRVVGVSFATDIRRPVYFDPQIKRLAESLSKALPQQPIVTIVDSDVEEQKMLIFAGSDVDPGVYYLLDRATHQMHAVIETRAALDGVALGRVRPIQYPAHDGTMIPAYLTLPPGKDSAKGLPAIVLPHGGPSARDEWGFDWLSQYYAARGFAVIQPNFRGSAGYGDAWFQKNGFQSWRIAIGDVTDAGRWLIAQGVDPAKLAIVGWSYGGYAALQSAAIDPALFKAVIAIAPVTDLVTLREESQYLTNHDMIRDFIGHGPHLHDGSPAQNADRITAPVLMFHGTLDRNVGIGESQLMLRKLKAAGKQAELVTWDGLDHYCDDSRVRTEMLVKSDAFLRAVLKL